MLSGQRKDISSVTNFSEALFGYQSFARIPPLRLQSLYTASDEIRRTPPQSPEIPVVNKRIVDLVQNYKKKASTATTNKLMKVPKTSQAYKKDFCEL